MKNAEELKKKAFDFFKKKEKERKVIQTGREVPMQTP